MSELFSEYGAASHKFAHLIRQPRHQAFGFGLVVILGVGVLFYSAVEGWSVIDSFYFTVIALTTIGLGDIAPTSEVSRLFTAFYAIVGVGVIGTALHLLIRDAYAAVNLSRDEVEEARRTAE